jgi:GNAT superfamily N-acetyltransferase
VEWRREDGYFVNDDPGLLDIDLIHRWLSEQSYWASGRAVDVVRRSFGNSLPIGCYGPGGLQVGICRWITDQATFAWLCDVFVDTAHRGDGLGTFLVESALSHPAVQGLRMLLATRDAHGLYGKFGFASPESSFMERR